MTVARDGSAAGNAVLEGAALGDVAVVECTVADSFVAGEGSESSSAETEPAPPEGRGEGGCYAKPSSLLLTR